MHKLPMKLWNCLPLGASKRPISRTTFHRRLEVELLETRFLMAGNATAALSGIAYIDMDGDRVHDAGEKLLPGVAITLTGKSGANVATATAVATTNANGVFTFANVAIGPAASPFQYQLTAGPVTGYVETTATIGNLNTLVGATVNTTPPGGSNPGPHNGGIDLSLVSLRQFSSDTTVADFVFVPIGSGNAQANYRENSTPTLKNNTALPNVTLIHNNSKSVNLAGLFTDTDTTNSRVTLNTTKGAINMDLFDTVAPQTVANFFDYVNSGAYNNTIFHRLVTGFVLQGGGFNFDDASKTIKSIEEHGTVPNEKGTSNTQGTIAMAQKGTDPNSATNQFFFNLVNNDGTGGNNLNTLNGGFTVFGKIVGTADQTVLTQLSTVTPNTPTDTTTGLKIKSGTGRVSPFNELPMLDYTGTNPPNGPLGATGSTAPSDATSANFIKLNSVTTVKRDEILTYTASSSNPSLVNAVLGTNANEMLRLVSTSNATGTATITVRATDRFGAFLESTFQVTVT